MGAKRMKRMALVQLPYAPPSGYRLDLEVMTVAELRRRADREQLRMPHRLDFVALIGVSTGRCSHVVDFAAHDCGAGSWLVVRPGQVQRYDTTSRWDGWQVVVRPEFLLPVQRGAASVETATYASLEALPTHIILDTAEHRAAMACVRQMQVDAEGAAPERLRHPLLRHQLYSLVLRLDVAQHRAQPQRDVAPVYAQRFKRFWQTVERDFASTHRVADYARRIGCSEKNLTRAVTAVAAQSAKAYLSRRVALEAKRLLVHTALPVATIAAKVGFSEPTNFVKFFKREAGISPGDFRHRTANAD